MTTVGFNLLTVALEVGADHIADYPPLLSIVKDALCRNFLSVSQIIENYSEKKTPFDLFRC